ncbi:hypothetical protein ACFV1H_17980 [Streptomyces virginiae]|uniref:hypothetical protein n=1 Tax=Streptomyces virginiae TaxID=1961 RepID=UPI0036C6C638
MTARDRLHVLRRAVRDYPGPWRTGMAHRLYLAKGLAPQRSTARGDLNTLVRQGLLYPTGPSHDRKFWLKERGR